VELGRFILGAQYFALPFWTISSFKFSTAVIKSHLLALIKRKGAKREKFEVKVWYKSDF